MGVRLRRAIAVFAVFTWVSFSASACLVVVRDNVHRPSTPHAEVEPVDADETLVIAYALPPDGLTNDELETMWALQDEGDVIAAELGGMLDGDGSGAESYDIYYHAPDARALWERLEPLMKTAPLELLFVELYPADEGAPIEIIEYGVVVDEAA